MILGPKCGFLLHPLDLPLDSPLTTFIQNSIAASSAAPIDVLGTLKLLACVLDLCDSTIILMYSNNDYTLIFQRITVYLLKVYM